MQDALRASIITLIGFVVAGCAAAPSVTDGGATTGEKSGPSSEQASDSLAEQARRDVETVLQRRGEDAPGSADAATTPRATRSDKPAIQWMSRDSGVERPATTATGAPPRAQTPRNATPTPAAPAGTDDPAALARPVDDPPAVTAPPRAVMSGAPSPGTDRVGELLVELSGELYRQSAYADQPLRELLAIASESMVRPDRALSPEAFRTLTEREREILGHFQEFFHEIGQNLDANQDSDAVINAALTTLRSRLVEEPKLTISDTALCYHVGGFGDYAAFDRNVFLAHEEPSRQVILYLGIDDFSSEMNERGQWVTELSQRLVIYNHSDGIPVWTDDWQQAVDRSREQRQDFFTVQVITLPKALSVGRYLLKIRVRDEKSGAETETSIPFEMVADAKLAAKVP